MRCVCLKSYFGEGTFKFDAEVKYQFISKDLEYLVGIIHYDRADRVRCNIRGLNVNDEFRNELYSEVKKVLGSISNHECYFLIAQKYESDEPFGSFYPKRTEQWCIGVCNINEMYLKPSVKERRACRDLKGYYLLDEGEKFSCYKLDELENIVYFRQQLVVRLSETFVIPATNRIDALLDLNEITIIGLYEKQKIAEPWRSFVNRTYLSENEPYSDYYVRGVLDLVLSYEVNMKNQANKTLLAHVNAVRIDKYIFEYRAFHPNTKEIVTYNKLDIHALVDEVFMPLILPRLDSFLFRFEFFGFKGLFRT